MVVIGKKGFVYVIRNIVYVVFLILVKEVVVNFSEKLKRERELYGFKGDLKFFIERGCFFYLGVCGSR